MKLEPYIKAAFQAATESEIRSLANMVEMMVVNYYCAHKNQVPQVLQPAASARARAIASR